MIVEDVWLKVNGSAADGPIGFSNFLLLIIKAVDNYFLYIIAAAYAPAVHLERGRAVVEHIIRERHHSACVVAARDDERGDYRAVIRAVHEPYVARFGVLREYHRAVGAYLLRVRRAQM